MTAHTVGLRVAVRPLRRVSLLDQLTTASPTVSTMPSPRASTSCLRSRMPRRTPHHRRLFSTTPPPPRCPLPPDSRKDSSSTVISLGPPPAPSFLSPSTSSLPSSSSPTPVSEQSEPNGSPPTTQSVAPDRPLDRPESSTSTSQSSDSSSCSSSSQFPSTQPSSFFAPPNADDATPDSPSSKNNDPSDRSLPSFSEKHRHPLKARFSTFMDNLQSRAVMATQTLNDLTGYSAIEAIKKRNSELEKELAAAQKRLREARQNYKSLTAHRAATQREVTTLLARKDTWNPLDLERFTTLYRSDHELEARVAEAAAELTDAETDESRLSAELNAGILKRYHEEQIWSDRIRRQSTWGTWGLMGVNVVLFLVLQFVAEPWRRKRMINGIVENQKGVMEEVKRELSEVRAALEASGLREAARAVEAAAARMDAAELSLADGGALPVGTAGAAAGSGEFAVPAGASSVEAETPAQPEWQAPRKPWKELLAEYWEDPELLKEDVTMTVQDLYSDRKADLRMKDVSRIALQGAAAGATLMAGLVLALMQMTRS